MSAYAVIGFKGNKKENKVGMVLANSFLILDLSTFGKFYADINFLKENKLNICLYGGMEESDWINLVISDNRYVYFGKRIFSIFDKITNSFLSTFDVRNNGICFVNDTLLFSDDKYILYTSPVVNHFAVAYFPCTDKIDLVYGSKSYSIFENDSYFYISNNRELDKTKNVSILYNDSIFSLFYRLATCVDGVYNIGEIYWTDEFYNSNGDTFLIPNGCISFYIIESDFCFDTIVFPPSVRLVECRGEFPRVELNKCYIKQSENERSIIMQIYKLIGHSGFDVEYY